ncbi:Acetylornithine deacetylase/Succinyl-diaminopimelate desuccinylase or related deacylase [Geosmithia morbida]|uniref:Acetylornithine deacetylase/Succinyl-diaminopimelate desuccinylase or related deacylase n=1 Tax=Geosmithia morbida TaxID=1094350 RepID=A0A9P5D6J8_9HYPO|nr:Acetylornithine deacetylase/Succinyl-diaminopimelate desuccinylase or related deacylase [Geosmithia morbida]KAF4124835.1 Acetylornithine deacetylase/Succinyl-diaminopimelate desuccinylase or related deacylase [Geosmithia morbida]
MARLSLNDDDKEVRLWLTEQAKAIGCTVTVDQMGNMFAVRPGKVSNVPPVIMGSHLDTQPTGGRYDGILGVTAGLEVLRTLHENGYETQGPLGLVNWTNEEGARFPITTVASAVWAETLSLDAGWSCKEVSSLAAGPTPKTLKEELERIGFLGDVPASYRSQPIAAHFELHIEQGPILEENEEKIGVVTGAQAYSWYEIEVVGRDSHAGTTPLAVRKDALLAAAKMIVESNEVARNAGGLITTGIIDAYPGSINTLPKKVRFTLDARHPSDEKLAGMIAKCRELFDDIAKNGSAKGVDVEWTMLTENTAKHFHKDCIAAVEEAAVETTAPLSGKDGRKLWRYMTSGAGHDSCNTSKRCPTAMIFTTTRNGMSHTPDEYCSPEDCVLGAQVLLGAVMRYDASRKL